MLKYRFIIMILGCCTLAACSNTRSVTTPKTDQSITIDGNLSDWNTGESLIENTETVNYYSAYDDNFLYLFIDITSAFTENAIQRSGLIVYLNHSEDMRKRTGIAFPSGSFNLLREDPRSFEFLRTDPDWMNTPANQERLKELAKDNFSRVMIVERPDGRSNPEYGFADLSQLEVDGFAISTNENSRLTTVEMRIPLDGSSVFGIQKEDLWIGFSIEPPDFRVSEQNYNFSGRTQTDRYGNRIRRPNASDHRRAINRNLGAYERWYHLQLN